MGKLCGEHAWFKYVRADIVREGLRARYDVIVDDRLRQWSVGGDFGPEHAAAREMVEKFADWRYLRSESSLPLGEDEEERVAKKDRDYDTAEGSAMNSPRDSTSQLVSSTPTLIWLCPLTHSFCPPSAQTTSCSSSGASAAFLRKFEGRLHATGRRGPDARGGGRDREYGLGSLPRQEEEVVRREEKVRRQNRRPFDGVGRTTS